MKKIVFFIIDLLVIYAIFVGVDAIKIKSDPFVEKEPFIVLDEVRNEENVIYKSIGYKMEYYLDKDGNIYGGSFILFNKFIIFAYVS